MSRQFLLLAAAFAAIIAVESSSSAKAPAQKSRWIGKPITIKTANADIADLLRLIADASGFNIVLGDGVKGSFPAISWEDVPWDQALDTILRTKRLHAERDGNLLRIVTNAEFVQEANEQLRAREPASR